MSDYDYFVSEMLVTEILWKNLTKLNIEQETY